MAGMVAVMFMLCGWHGCCHVYVIRLSCDRHAAVISPSYGCHVDVAVMSCACCGNVICLSCGCDVVVR